ncbi:NFYB/HAP3 family transcription factor subunit [Candidatus Pacearchaeota archaeon]|nr:NFYB/HAP3 family transcription factor subunit [Candidatus Pacearchaeota archaeon]
MVHLVVKKNIRKIAKDINISEDVSPALDKKIEQIIKEAIARAKANGRKTLQGKDI